MTEQGVIIKTEKGQAVVRVDKKEQCDKCGMCLFPKNASHIEFNAENKLNASVGDTVIIERQKDSKLLGAILVFLVPLLLIGVSALITYFFIGIEIWLLILSVIFIIMWYNILAVIDKRLKNKLDYKFVIVQILGKGEQNHE